MYWAENQNQPEFPQRIKEVSLYRLYCVPFVYCFITSLLFILGIASAKRMPMLWQFT